MFIHHYDSITGQYISSSLAAPDPMNANRWLVPAFATQEPLPDRPRLTWPFFNGSAWELRPDYRGMMLYRQDSGDRAEILVPGVTPNEARLTETPRPSDDHHFVGGDWVINPEAVTKRQFDDAMAEFEQRMALAKSKNAGKADALAADLLDVAGAALFKAWAAYQVALVAVVESDSFPAGRVWPEEPDETTVAAQAYADEAEKEANAAAAAEAEAIKAARAGAPAEAPSEAT